MATGRAPSPRGVKTVGGSASVTSSRQGPQLLTLTPWCPQNRAEWALQNPRCTRHTQAHTLQSPRYTRPGGSHFFWLHLFQVSPLNTPSPHRVSSCREDRVLHCFDTVSRAQGTGWHTALSPQPHSQHTTGTRVLNHTLSMHAHCLKDLPSPSTRHETSLTPCVQSQK